MQLAVFDVCDTIYRVNTTFSFLDHFFENNKKYQFYRKMTKFFPIRVVNYFFYKLFKKDIIRLYGTYFLKGKTVEEVQKYTQKFVCNDLVKEIKNSIYEMIRNYKNQGYKIVLMSGSYTFVIEEVAKYFNADYFFASKLIVINEHYTGKYDNDIIFTKYEILKREFNQIDKLVVVSNNKSDLKLMQFAQKSFAVCNRESDTKFWNKYKNITCIKDY
jgi:HAD superfamily phosphoserine phosphatase-like hydrolase